MPSQWEKRNVSWPHMSIDYVSCLHVEYGEVFVCGRCVLFAYVESLAQHVESLAQCVMSAYVNQFDMFLPQVRFYRFYVIDVVWPILCDRFSCGRLYVIDSLVCVADFM